MSDHIRFRVTAEDLRQFDVSVTRSMDLSAIVSPRGGVALNPNEWRWSIRRRTHLSGTTGCGVGSAGEAKTRDEALGRAMARLVQQLEAE